ncbi:GNAT family N-acetyltransferase [Rhizobium sullae]|uniref:L-amino acid N-acyltransferase YncA n=1 Tax=Rhizobium sullae TaxID=50338 RepID=A0A4R3PT50_RHISU|nr:GNAT family N-acetyltransferase [Rhizobium sullae]TCU10035.1 L-amino acid N-acyltransferase YncA [Rhizobium sullae]
MTVGKYLIRAATTLDSTALALLLNRIVEEGDKTAIDTTFDAREFQQWFITGPHCRSCVVAEATDGRLLGFQALERYHDLPEGWADIATFLDASARGKGIGKALREKTFEAAEALGIGVLRAVVRAQNAQAIAYYRECGFMPSDGYSSKEPAQQDADKVTLTRRL